MVLRFSQRHISSGKLSLGKPFRRVNLSTYYHLEPMLRISGAITPLPYDLLTWWSVKHRKVCCFTYKGSGWVLVAQYLKKGKPTYQARDLSQILQKKSWEVKKMAFKRVIKKGRYPEHRISQTEEPHALNTLLDSNYLWHSKFGYTNLPWK